MPWDIETADDQFLIELSERAAEEAQQEPSDHPFYRRRVFQISENIAVKVGYVSAAEVAMQQFAYEHVDPKVVRVPKVHRFLTPPGIYSNAYLFMDHVPGKDLAALDLPHDDIVPRVAKIVQHLGQIPGSSRPGPVAGGELQGYLWGDDGTDTEFHSISEFNAWLNKRLALRDLSIDLSDYPLVLCHMDMCRRNLIMPEDGGAMYLIDWAHAGFFPRFFEPATFPCFGAESMDYSKRLLRATDDLIHLTEEEHRLIKLMHIVRAANLRYSFGNTKGTDVKALLSEWRRKKASASASAGCG